MSKQETIQQRLRIGIPTNELQLKMWLHEILDPQDKDWHQIINDAFIYNNKEMIDHLSVQAQKLVSKYAAC